MRGVSICTGIGGLDRAAENAGIDIIGQVEYDEACIRVLEKHWPDTPRRRDVREFNGDEFGDFDILFGGIPCQPYSVAGKKLAEADPRDLWPDTCRIVRRMQPRWVVIENVANFARLALDRVWTDLEAEGYTVGACVLPACAFGATHRRERCFTLAYSAGKVGLREAPRQTGQHSGIGQGDGWFSLSQSLMGRATDGTSRWLDSRFPAAPGHPQHEWEAPRVLPSSAKGDRSRLKQLGNAVVWQQAYPIFAALIAVEEALHGRS